jgi:hypothetical protein
VLEALVFSNPFLAERRDGSTDSERISWHEGTVGFSPDSVGYVSLAIDPSDTPYVAYGAKGYGYTRATVMVFK